jgi:hypothetical protein
MPKIRIESPSAEQGLVGRVISAHGTRLFLDDVEVQDLGDIEMRFPVDGVVECHFGVLATDGFTLETHADVHVHLHVPQDQTVIDITTSETPGRKLLVVKRAEEISHGSD